jgi:hypothetical protein
MLVTYYTYTHSLHLRGTESLRLSPSLVTGQTALFPSCRLKKTSNLLGMERDRAAVTGIAGLLTRLYSSRFLCRAQDFLTIWHDEIECTKVTVADISACP